LKSVEAKGSNWGTTCIATQPKVHLTKMPHYGQFQLKQHLTEQRNPTDFWHQNQWSLWSMQVIATWHLCTTEWFKGTNLDNKNKPGPFTYLRPWIPSFQTTEMPSTEKGLELTIVQRPFTTIARETPCASSWDMEICRGPIWRSVWLLTLNRTCKLHTLEGEVPIHWTIRHGMEFSASASNQTFKQRRLTERWT
jgi:hypothetical protein